MLWVLNKIIVHIVYKKLIGSFSKYVDQVFSVKIGQCPLQTAIFTVARSQVGLAVFIQFLDRMVDGL